MKTIKVNKKIIIDAPVSKVFPLACPVLEYDWIPGWKCELIYCPNGINEEGVVFKEKLSAPFITGRANTKTEWITLKHDTSNCHVVFQWNNEYATAQYEIKMENYANGKTQCMFNLNYTITERGQRKLPQKIKGKIEFLVEGLGGMLKNYCETGEMLNTNGSKRKKEFTDQLTFKEKWVFAVNKLSMKMMRDRDRKSYLSTGKITQKSATQPKPNF